MNLELAHLTLHDEDADEDNSAQQWQEPSRWEFVRDMLTEVSVYLYFLAFTPSHIHQTAPTLFLTVLGLVFTGELLERVSVSHHTQPYTHLTHPNPY